MKTRKVLFPCIEMNNERKIKERRKNKERRTLGMKVKMGNMRPLCLSHGREMEN